MCVSLCDHNICLRFFLTISLPLLGFTGDAVLSVATVGVPPQLGLYVASGGAGRFVVGAPVVLVGCRVSRRIGGAVLASAMGGGEEGNGVDSVGSRVSRGRGRLVGIVVGPADGDGVGCARCGGKMKGGLKSAHNNEIKGAIHSDDTAPSANSPWEWVPSTEPKLWASVWDLLSAWRWGHICLWRCSSPRSRT